MYQTRHKHWEPLAWRLTRPEEEDSTGNNITASGDVEQMKKDKNCVFCVLGEVKSETVQISRTTTTVKNVLMSKGSIQVVLVI